MIKIIESRLLVEKQMDDILNGLVKRLADDYNVDIEKTTFTRTDPDQLNEDQDILFIFAMLNRAYKRSDGTPTSSPFAIGFHDDPTFLTYTPCLYVHNKYHNLDKYSLGHDGLNDGLTYMDHNGNTFMVKTGKRFSLFSFDYLVRHCYAAYVLQNFKTSLDQKVQRDYAKRGSIDRYTNPYIQDKSGYYVNGTGKYRKMLAVVDRYRNLYNEVTNTLSSLPENQINRINDYCQNKLYDFMDDAKRLLSLFDKAKANNSGDTVSYIRSIRASLAKYESTIEEILNQLK